MADKLEQAISRLQTLADKAQKEGIGMDISDIVEAILGPDYDKELEDGGLLDNSDPQIVLEKKLFLLSFYVI